MVPAWMRTLSTLAFDGDYESLPRDTQFDAAIREFVPEDAAHHPGFVTMIRTAHLHAGPCVALWLARELKRHRLATISAEHAAVIAFYADASNSSGPLAMLVDQAWSEDMSLPAAARITQHMLHWLVFFAYTGPEGLVDTWRRGGTYRGFDFVPLTTARDYIEVARGLQNCLYGYAGRLIVNRNRLFAIYRNGALEAAVELVRDERGAVAKGPVNARCNVQVECDVDRAVYAFLAEAPSVFDGEDRPRQAFRKLPQRKISSNWQALVAPYLADHASATAVSSSASEAAFTVLLRRANGLSRIAERPRF
jgi:hypothetical protein